MAPPPTDYTRHFPWPVRDGGGTFLPWTSRHEMVARRALICAGLPTDQPRPVMWIARMRFFRNANDSLMAIAVGAPLPPDSARWSEYWAAYSPREHAIVFSPILPVAMFWTAFAHEVTHSVERVPTPHDQHSERFARLASCMADP